MTDGTGMVAGDILVPYWMVLRYHNVALVPYGAIVNSSSMVVDGTRAPEFHYLLLRD